jgi:hypothetical protein
MPDGKTVSVSGSDLGADAGNYNCQYHGLNHSEHTARALTVSALRSRVYDAHPETVTFPTTSSRRHVHGKLPRRNLCTKTSETGKRQCNRQFDTGTTRQFPFNATASTTADITARHPDGDRDRREQIYDGTTACDRDSWRYSRWRRFVGGDGYCDFRG